VAFAVGKAVGGAVDRNRVRRRLRAAVREHVDRFEPGSAYLIGAGREALSMSFPDLCRALVAVLDPSGGRP
jgi:ribonuclease P protein component